jgi:hypothetical protein
LDTISLLGNAKGAVGLCKETSAHGFELAVCARTNMDILVTFLFSVNALSLSPECRIPEAGFTCAARPALALVVAGEEKGESVYGHTLLFTKTLLVGQPVGFPAGRPTGWVGLSI